MKIFSVRILSKQNGPSSSPRGIPVVTESGETNMETQDFSSDMKELTLDVMQTISNKDFLRVSRNNRLQHITEPAVKSSELQEGKTVIITFTFNNKLNKELFLRTTAGQVFPPNIEELTFGGTVFKRDGLYGEFFTDTGSRLIIRDGNGLTVSKVRTPENISAVEVALKKESESFGELSDIGFEAKKRGIDAEFAILAFGEKIKSLKDPKRLVAIEDLLTDFGRAKGAYGMTDIKSEKGIYRSGLALSLLSVNNADWKEKAEKYGISSTEIQNYVSEGSTNLSLEESLIDNGENLKGEALWSHPPFQEKLLQICAYLGVNPSDMKKVMIKESKINPKALNPLSTKATGLIQFTEKTAKGLGTTVGLLRGMSGVEQLTYVQRYFEPYRGKLGSVEDLYLATFYPVALGKSDDFIMGSEPSSRLSPELIANQNWVIAPGKSVITVGDFKRYVART